MCSKQYYDLGRSELVCPECGKEIEVTTMSRPRRGRKPGRAGTMPSATKNAIATARVCLSGIATALEPMIPSQWSLRLLR